jgi:hypothetical protein
VKVVWDGEAPPGHWKKVVGFPFTRRKERERDHKNCKKKNIEELAC